MSQNSRGFSFVEMMVSIGIISLLAVIASYSFGDNLKNKELITITDDIVATLELARSNAITGKGSTAYGVKFNSDSYIGFVGSSYISSNQSNDVNTISSKYTISNDIPGADDKIVFSKVKGESNHSSSVTVTISEVGGSRQKQVTIGTLGDVTVVQ
jgi:type IV fimbrial biogenesis protein FimT